MKLPKYNDGRHVLLNDDNPCTQFLRLNESCYLILIVYILYVKKKSKLFLHILIIIKLL